MGEAQNAQALIYRLLQLHSRLVPRHWGLREETQIAGASQEKCSSGTIVVVLRDVLTQAGCPGNCHWGGADSGYTDSLERPTTLEKSSKAIQRTCSSMYGKHIETSTWCKALIFKTQPCNTSQPCSGCSHGASWTYSSLFLFTCQQIPSNCKPVWNPIHGWLSLCFTLAALWSKRGIVLYRVGERHLGSVTKATRNLAIAVAHFHPYGHHRHHRQQTRALLTRFQH